MTEDPIVRASLGGTALLAVVAVAGIIEPDPPVGVVVAVVSLLLFAVGIGAFVVTLLKAADRSRREELHVPGLWWLAGGTAPKEVRRLLVGSFLAQVVIAFVAASIQPYTGVAFAILAPLQGLGLTGLWGARHGTFGPRATRPPV
jgi:hypothetical protein